MRTLFNVTTLSFVLVCANAACSISDDTDEIPNSPIAAEASDSAANITSSDANTYFEIVADLRKCASPVCGGWFLERLNNSSTQCHDGRYATSCYTPVLDWSQARLTEEQKAAMQAACNEGALSGGGYAMVRGRFARTNSTTPRPDLGRFVITEVWLAENLAISSGTYVKVTDNGLRCFAPPCASWTELKLNRTATADIADVDFTPAGLSDDEVADSTQEMSGPYGLVVAGDRFTFTVNGTAALGRTATTAFYRLPPVAR